MITKMLVGFDASEESYKAFDFALDMAVSHKSEPEILVLSVVRPPEGMNLFDTGSLIDEATKEFKTELKGLEEKAGHTNVRISTEVAVGHPAATIVKFAEERSCSLIIVGHRGRSKLGGLLLGSVSRHIASLAGCTVVIVR
ncbi:MAG: universal stress protein [Candidatus Sulfobium sp.]|jgi:nucleotide-binding universal stress UspA family protein